MKNRDQLAKLARQSILLVTTPALMLLVLAVVLSASGHAAALAPLVGAAIGWLAFTMLMSLRILK